MCAHLSIIAHLATAHWKERLLETVTKNRRPLDRHDPHLRRPLQTL